MRNENTLLYVVGTLAFLLSLLLLLTTPAHARGWGGGSHYSRGEHVDGNNKKDYNTRGY